MGLQLQLRTNGTLEEHLPATTFGAVTTHTMTAVRLAFTISQFHASHFTRRRGRQKGIQRLELKIAILVFFSEVCHTIQSSCIRFCLRTAYNYK